ncbi:MAG TPA: diguanylate cyclase [Candidatus Gastranaerophilaceae bacterium]|nr:diguanylate cyclase [Candidatus Gastranaerophilaceae bacterium]
MKKISVSKKVVNNLVYFFSFMAIILMIFLFFKIAKINDFFTLIENRTFDWRQTLLSNSGHKKVNDNIVIITVDDASFEYLLEKYGEWPIPRDVYANVIYYLEKQKPKTIAFDFMFVKSMKSRPAADLAVSKAINDNPNVFVGMNFDNQSYDIRKPTNLPSRFSIKLKNDASIDFYKELEFSNCRSILSQLLNGKANIGIINASRADDGILRKMPPFLIYQREFYPHLSLLVALDYLKKTENLDLKDFHIDKHKNMQIGKRTIPFDSDGGVILNWYAPAGKAFKYVPLYKVIKAMEKNQKMTDIDFKDKLIYLGTTAVSLYDTKSVPVDKLYPGVEVHTTFINNLLDNNFIKKADEFVNIAISLVLALIVSIIVISTASTFISLSSAILITALYLIFSYYIMKFANIWVGIVMPITAIVLMFAFAYIVKYLLKSRDFEHQYRLATTDGLTDLYNHRFFQEQMIMQVENCRRYNSHFSLILIDIDYFKKFNDKFGHQSGDAVLRQVAQVLKKNVRSTDVVCRYGGEEMSIILPNTDRDEVIITAQKICQAVAAKPFKLGSDIESIVTISLGVSTYPQDGNKPSELIDKADQGLYNAKENGRNQVGI